ncbi:MAG: MJ0042-type zinc finger domain-containing protein, partial [Tagaea sp.]
MIVACPNCAARFRVADDALGAHGRHVRCGNCGHGWVQKPRQAVLEINPRFPRTEKRWKKDEPAAPTPAPVARHAGRGLVDMT